MRDVQRLLIGREADTVGPRHFLGQQRQLAALLKRYTPQKSSSLRPDRQFFSGRTAGQ
jgi:hypothetical protein